MSMPDSFFRYLSPEEERVFRQWARDNWRDEEPNELWHPVVRNEWHKITLNHHCYGAGA